MNIINDLDKWNIKYKGMSRKELKKNIYILELENQYLKNKIKHSKIIDKISKNNYMEQFYHKIKLQNKIHEQEKYIKVLENKIKPSFLNIIKRFLHI